MGKSQSKYLNAARELEKHIQKIESSMKTERIDPDSYEGSKELEHSFRHKADLSISIITRRHQKKGLALFDAGKLFVKKRFNAAMQLISEAHDRFSDAFPNLCIEKEWISANAVFTFATYDFINTTDYVTLAAALWILDELSIRGKLPETLKLLPHADAAADVRIPELFEDACFDNTVIRGMMYLIGHRNDESDIMVDWLPKPFINEQTVKRSETVHTYERTAEPSESLTTNRARFDRIISMIHPEVIERISKRFEAKFWEAFECYLKIADHYRTEELAAATELHKALLKMKDLYHSMDQANHEMSRQTEMSRKLLTGAVGNPLLAKQPSIEDFLKQEVDQSSSVESLGTMAGLISTADILSDFADAQSEKINEINSLHELAAYYLGSSPSGTDDDEPTGEALPDMTPMRLLEIQNPYETCFAFLYLLDSGNPLPWMVPLGSTVVRAATRLLPWEVDNEIRDEFDEYSEDDEHEFGASEEEEFDYDAECENADESNEALGDAGSDITETEDLTPIDWIDEEAKLYEQKYTDKFNYPSSSEDRPLHKLNFPQLIYLLTMVAIPRDIFSFGGMVEDLIASGVPEGEAALLEKYFTLADANSSKTRTHFFFDRFTIPAEDKTEPPVEKDETPSTAEENKRADQEIRQLKEDNNLLQAKHRALIRETDELKAANAKLERELKELRTLIRAGADSNRSERKDRPEIKFPYAANGRYVVFGGHDSWLRAIRPLLDNVRFLGPGTKPNAGLILNADAVWIQSNAISHSNFYKIINIIRTHGVPIRYFSFASAEKCAEELALADLGYSAEPMSDE